MKMHTKVIGLLVAGLLVSCVHKQSVRVAGLELNRYFSNDMVLQRDKPLKVWGTAGTGEPVTVTFAGQSVSARADQDGRWVVTLKAVKATTTPQALTVKSAKKTVTLSNILVGDVFLFARQSSVEVSLGTTPEGRKAAAAFAANKAYRFIRIKTTPSRTPLDNLKKDATSGWQAVDKKGALTMSAAAFYLGRDLGKEAGVPVGIVDLDMGYHFPAAWLSDKGLDIAQGIPGAGARDLKRERECLPKDIEAWDKGISDYVREGDTPHHRPKPYEGPLRGMSPIEMPHTPGVCYNAIVHPLRGMALKGMLLQLGNDYPWLAFTRIRNLGLASDGTKRGRASGQSYAIIKTGKRMTPQVLPGAASDLRRSIGDDSLPVAWIMPPGSDQHQIAVQSRDARELLRRATSGSKAIDLILPGAEYIRMSGQLADEALLASRCKRWALVTFYNTPGPASGPVFDRVEFKNGMGIIHYKSGTGRGLSAEGDALKHFEVAAQDGKFFPCTARIEGSTITLTSKDVPQMAYARYGWAHKPVQGLVNSAGLPALPFTTDPKWKYEYWPGAGPLKLTQDLPAGADIAIIPAPGGKPKKHDKETTDPKRLVTLVKDATRLNHGMGPLLFPEAEWQRWRLKAIETLAHAPEGWEKPGFDDSSWDDVILPVNWPGGHVGLLRTTFQVKDPQALESLQINAMVYKIRCFKVYLNGHLAARVNIVGRKFGIGGPLTPYALKLLRSGSNSLAIVADHGNRVAGMGFTLSGRLKDDQKEANR